MSETQQRVESLLHAAGETHHTVYTHVNGEDPDWSLWYAHWLFTLSDLRALLPKLATESGLVFALVKLDKEYTSSNPDDAWQSYYARVLIDMYS